MKLPYAGRVALIDLSNRKVEYWTPDENLLRSFLGGASLSAALYVKARPSLPPPLSPENPLIFMTGPLTATRAPTSNRYSVSSRSPLTGLWGEATSGGAFGAKMKLAGFDGIVVTGVSETPVYIFLSDGRAEIREAKELWGLGTYATQRLIKQELGSSASVACIGPAGENLVKISAIINDAGRAAARTGLGAVMGSKKLKAIAAIGDGVIGAATEEFESYARELWSKIATSLSAQAMRELGTASYFDIGYDFGDIPGKYFTSLEFDPSQLSGSRLREVFKVEPLACYMCPIGCGRRVRVEGGIVDGPEYETLASLGSLNLVADIKAVVEANHLCNDLGLDTISTGVTIAFLNYSSERGYVSGMKPRWGDGEALKSMIVDIAYRRGLGDTLAEGVRVAAKRLGVPEEIAAHVKGLEIPMHDPRAFYSVALSYATGPRGACHLRADSYLADMGAFEDPELGIGPGEFHTLEGKASVVIAMQNLREVFNSALLCIFTGLKSSELARLLSLATGWDIDSKAVFILGDRSFTLKRVINNALGVTRRDDRLPEIVLQPYSSGPIAGKTPKQELDHALDEYYALRGWDAEGRPTDEKILSLGLSEYKSILSKHA
ncbi:aldehyde ferredoxin oxidoreductase family protein [Infirmifilum sp. NZ]|uniref:aldehyde ferredoxin oxidoreductase family protein n=1 Tax=Infirmifilum sp. NZ TaxID=2926850 RepID=UPI0027A8A130|nr:aldehyde ferredoxin oxidoreductase family protein [Infirmifilum sp. NZ]UNQ73477.1 aldehyde ferredoxin oxidoreductase family protein [Infirmifilum sp. NZ]